MPIIKKLKNFFTREIVYPVTMEKAVYDENGLRLDAKMPFRFGIDADGNYGYYKDGADTVTPFRMNGVYIKDFTFTEDTSTQMTFPTPLSSINNVFILANKGFSVDGFLKGDGVRRLIFVNYNYIDDNTLNYATFNYSHPTTAGTGGATSIYTNIAARLNELRVSGGNVIISNKLNGVETHFAKDVEYVLIAMGKE